LREVQALWVESGHYAVPCGDLATELFDMTRTEGRITLRDLVESGTGGMVLGLLASVTECVIAACAVLAVLWLTAPCVCLHRLPHRRFGLYDTREDERAANTAVPSPAAASE